jgi:3-phosphoshikimate 1-carboxyvinyltransferase
VRRPLDSLDARSAAAAARQLGAKIDMKDGLWTIAGTAGRPRPPRETIDVGNSGTTLRLMLSAAALASGRAVFTGDEQIQRRPVGPLLEALGALGAKASSHRGNGCAPCEVTGPIRGGDVRIACRDSQYLSSLLISTPLAQGETRITVTELNERPYVEMTLWWLERSGIRLQRDGLERFSIPGGQGYGPFEMEIPGDWSSATFFMAAAALAGGTVELRGLRTDDHQGDMRVADVLETMGARVERGADRIRVTGAALKGGEFDLNAIPDSLPALAVAAACAEGRTRLVNVPQARLKETDRIRAMAEELPRMGARVRELPDGLEIEGGRLRGAGVSGRGDHRIVMALAVAGLVAKGATVIDTAEAMAVTFPEFVRLMQDIGAVMRTED